MAIRIFDIQWDTDGIDPEELGLKSEMVIDAEAEGIEDPDGEIADWLSDKYGWCVHGFRHEPAPDPEQQDADASTLPETPEAPTASR